MSNDLYKDVEPGLLPQTLDRLHAQAVLIEAVTESVLTAFERMKLDVDTCFSVTSLVMGTLIETTPPRHPGDHAQKVQALRGFIAALEAYCNAETHDAGLAAIDVARRALNLRSASALDVDVATSTAPRN